MTEDKNYRSGNVAIVGRPNVGKSTLLNSLIQQKVSITSKKAQTTRFRINGILTIENAQFVFVDTPGFQTKHLNQLNMMMNRVVTKSVSDVDVILFVIESMRYDERDQQVLALLPSHIPVILVINKIDRLADRNQLLPFLEKMAGEFQFAAIIPVSAAHKIQLQELIQSTRALLPEGQPLFDQDEITDRSERFHAAELIREKLFRLIGEEVPYSTSVMIERFKIENNIYQIHATILVGKENQKGIIIGKNGEKLKLIATQARKDMEVFFDHKVFLEVWVKVRKGWADSAHVLRSLGYE